MMSAMAAAAARCCTRRICQRKLMLTSFLLACGIVTVGVLLHIVTSIQSRLQRTYVCKLWVPQAQRVDYGAYISNTTTEAGVPLIMHFIYKDANVLQSYRDTLETCLRLNPNWSVMLWTDEDVSLLLSREYPDMQRVFRMYPHKLQRSDATRYAILYKFGGVYLDLDMRCHQPLLTSLRNIPCFLDKERSHQTRILYDKDTLVMNSAMGCRPGHPFFKKILDFVFHPDRLKGGFIHPYTILATTGPLMLTNQYSEWAKTNPHLPVTLLSESYFSPNINPRSNVFGACRKMVAGMNRKSPHKSAKELVCLELERLGFEKGDATFITNVTVAIHEFTHLGYFHQGSAVFDSLSQFPRILQYTNICWGVATASTAALAGVSTIAPTL